MRRRRVEGVAAADDAVFSQMGGDGGGAGAGRDVDEGFGGWAEGGVDDVAGCSGGEEEKQQEGQEKLQSCASGWLERCRRCASRWTSIPTILRCDRYTQDRDADSFKPDVDPDAGAEADEGALFRGFWGSMWGTGGLGWRSRTRWVYGAALFTLHRAGRRRI